MAIRALSRGYGVRSRQGEVREVVIEGGVQPIGRVVALRTIVGEVAGNVVGVCRGLKIFQMASRTRGSAQVVIVVDVAVCAFTRGHRMSTGQQETSRGVIKLSVEPIVSAVAALARGGKFGADVTGIVGRLKILHVARSAGGGHRLKLAVRRTFVA